MYHSKGQGWDKWTTRERESESDRERGEMERKCVVSWYDANQ